MLNYLATERNSQQNIILDTRSSMRSTKTSATGVDSDGHNEESHNGMEIKENIDTVDNDDEATRYKKRK